MSKSGRQEYKFQDKTNIQYSLEQHSKVCERFCCTSEKALDRRLTKRNLYL